MIKAIGCFLFVCVLTLMLMAQTPTHSAIGTFFNWQQGRVFSMVAGARLPAMPLTLITSAMEEHS